MSTSGQKPEKKTREKTRLLGVGGAERRLGPERLS
jgi:hypothetical protein